MKMMEVPAEVLSNKPVGNQIYHLKLKVNKFPSSKPGQFVMVKVNEGFSPLLRRPFAIFNQLKDYIEICYKVVGEGTEILSQKSPGESVRVLGPLGNGFKVSGAASIIISGGIGIATLFYLIKKLGKKATVLYGAKDKSEFVFLQDIKKTGARIFVTTEDGSIGRKGMVTELLDEKLIEGHKYIYACGPNIMLKKIARFAERFSIDCQVSMEAKMACGFGVCLGCVVPVTNSGSEEKEYSRVCADGPVFDARVINWNLLK